MEAFGLDEHIPKSLDCRHAVCTECLMNPCGQPLQLCPICRRGIGDQSTLPNDLTLISYLEEKKRKQYVEERNEKIKSLIEQVLEGCEYVNGRLKEEKQSTAWAVEERSAIFTSYTRHLFDKCQQRCNSKHFLAGLAMKNGRELESSLEQLQSLAAVCTSLLDNPHVTTDEIDRCEVDIQEAIMKARDIDGVGDSQEATWNSYRQLLIETFAEISKVVPSSAPSFYLGNASYFCHQRKVFLLDTRSPEACYNVQAVGDSEKI